MLLLLAIPAFSQIMSVLLLRCLQLGNNELGISLSLKLMSCRCKLSSNIDPYHRARLTAVKAPHSGDWLLALPASPCGLRLSEDAVRVAVGLRLGVKIREAHIFAHLVKWLTSFGTRIACHVYFPRLPVPNSRRASPLVVRTNYLTKITRIKINVSVISRMFCIREGSKTRKFVRFQTTTVDRDLRSLSARTRDPPSVIITPECCSIRTTVLIRVTSKYDNQMQ
jgi:hypothetical protein